MFFMFTVLKNLRKLYGRTRKDGPRSIIDYFAKYVIALDTSKKKNLLLFINDGDLLAQ